MPSTVTKNDLVIAPTWVEGYDSQAYANSEEIPNSAGASLLGFLAVSSSASTLYLMFFDAAATPNNGAIPAIMPVPLAQNTPVNIFLGDVPGGRSMYGWKFKTGIYWAVSTTPGTLTLDNSNSVWLTARYAN